MTEEPERRQGYDELNAKINKKYEGLETRLEKFFSKALFAFAIIGMATAISLLGFGLVLNAQSDTAKTIQQQRYESLLNSCLDQNVRHDNVIKRIDEAVAGTPAPQRKQAELSAKPFKLILEAAVPYTADCRVYSASRVRGAR